MFNMYKGGVCVLWVVCVTVLVLFVCRGVVCVFGVVVCGRFVCVLGLVSVLGAVIDGMNSLMCVCVCVIPGARRQVTYPTVSLLFYRCQKQPPINHSMISDE